MYESTEMVLSSRGQRELGNLQLFDWDKPKRGRALNRRVYSTLEFVSRNQPVSVSEVEGFYQGLKIRDKGLPRHMIYWLIMNRWVDLNGPIEEVEALLTGEPGFSPITGAESIRKGEEEGR